MLIKAVERRQVKKLNVDVFTSQLGVYHTQNVSFSVICMLVISYLVFSPI